MNSSSSFSLSQISMGNGGGGLRVDDDVDGDAFHYSSYFLMFLMFLRSVSLTVLYLWRDL